MYVEDKEEYEPTVEYNIEYTDEIKREELQELENK